MSIARATLAAALVGLLALCFLVARQYDVRQAPLVASGSSGIIVLDLSASVFEGGFEATVRKLVRTDERAGLVVFSDTAYELLPPGSSGREFQPLLRFFRSSTTGFLPPNPWDRFRAGTRISEGLKVARESLEREGQRGGTLVLLSDLEILPDEVQRLVTVLADLRRDGYDLLPCADTRILVLLESVHQSGLHAESGTRDERYTRSRRDIRGTATEAVGKLETD